MRCARILLLSGWFLMLPPLALKDHVDEKRPFREWEHDSSYDTAKACEEVRNRNWSINRERQGKKLLAERFMLARCIPSDLYPQLLKQP